MHLAAISQRCFRLAALAALACLAALVVLSAPGAAWTGSDSSYNARDNQGGDGGPTNVFSAYDYEATTGWTCPAGANADETYVAVAVPSSFDFAFYGSTVSTAYVSSNGFVGFEDPFGAYSASAAIPDAFDPNSIIAVNWEDLNPNDAGGGHVCHQIFGSGSTQRAAILYDNVRHFGNNAIRVHAVLVLFEDGDVVELHYSNSQTDGGVNGYENAGIENAAGSSGISYFDTEAATTFATNAVQFRPVSSFPTAAADAYTLDFVADSGVLEVDGSTGKAKLLSNDGQLGNVGLYPTYVSGLASGASLQQLSSGTCSGTSPVLSSDGGFCFTPPSTNPCGTDGTGQKDYTFTYRADDAFPDDTSSPYQDQATVTIAVKNCNKAPAATDDSASTSEDTYVDINVLGNDNDADGDTLTIDSATDPAKGSTAIVSGKVRYTPDANVCGTTDSFSYTMSDGKGGSDTGDVTISAISCVNDAPVATSGLTLSVLEEGSATGTLAATEPADGTSSFTFSVQAQGSKGTATVTNAATGAYSYTGSSNAFGADTFTFKACDAGGLCDTDTVAVTITNTNDAPVAVNDAVAVNEDSSATFSALANDHSGVDAGASPAETFSLVSVAGGTIGTPSIVGSQLKYTPMPNLYGADSFTYTMQDQGGLTATATVSVSVGSVNDPPTAVDDLFTGIAPYSSDNALDVLQNDFITPDVGETLTIAAVGAPSKGGTATLNLAKTRILYTPAPGFEDDSETIAYTLSDGSGGTAPGTATVGVAPADLVAHPDSYSLVEDTVLTATAGGATPGVIDNDDNLDNDPLTVTYTQPAQGTVVLQQDGSFTYTPPLHYFGTTTFTYTLDDGTKTHTGTVTLDVLGRNDAPSATAVPVSVVEDAGSSAIAAATLSAGPANEAQGLTISVVADVPALFSVQPQLSASGTLSFTPAPDRFGLATLTVTLQDPDGTANGGQDTAVFTIPVTVQPVNDPPVVTVQVPVHVSQEDTGPQTVPGALLVTPGPFETGSVSLDVSTTSGLFAVGPAAALDGTLTYTAKPDAFGVAIVQVVASDADGGADTSAPALLTIAVTADLTDPPVAGVDTLVIPEDAPETVVPLLANDHGGADVGETLGIAAWGPAPVGVTALVGGVATYTPPADFYQNPPGGYMSVPYVLADGNGGFAAGTARIVVQGVNDPPVALSDEYIVAVDTPLEVPDFLGVLANDVDPDNRGPPAPHEDPMSAKLGQPPSHGQLVFAADGSFTYTPHAGFRGQDTFTYAPSDKTTTGTTERVYLEVTSNQRPTARFVGPAGEVAVGAALTFLDMSSDPDGPIDAWQWSFGDGAVSSEPSPTHVFTRPCDCAVRLQVWDPEGLVHTAVQRVLVTYPLTAPRAAPVANAGPDQTVLAGTHVVLNGTGGDARDALTFEWTQLGGPRVALAGLGTATPSFRAPAPSEGVGVLRFALTIFDGYQRSAPDTVDVFVGQAQEGPRLAVDAGFDASAEGGQRIHLVGTVLAGSTDAAYGWVQTSGTPVRLHVQGADVEFVAPHVVGPIGLKFTATHAGLQASDEVTVHVTSAQPFLVERGAGGRLILRPNVEGELFAWDLGDGGKADGETATHAYAQPGTYTVALTATDGAGRATTYAAPVTVEAAPAGPAEAPRTFPWAPVLGGLGLFAALAAAAVLLLVAKGRRDRQNP